ncbi:MAG: hypothetical protein U0893_10945 [Chloroflexota bacterium]
MIERRRKVGKPALDGVDHGQNIEDLLQIGTIQQQSHGVPLGGWPAR